MSQSTLSGPGHRAIGCVRIGSGDARDLPAAAIRRRRLRSAGVPRNRAEPTPVSGLSVTGQKAERRTWFGCRFAARRNGLVRTFSHIFADKPAGTKAAGGVSESPGPIFGSECAAPLIPRHLRICPRRLESRSSFPNVWSDPVRPPVPAGDGIPASARYHFPMIDRPAPKAARSPPPRQAMELQRAADGSVRGRARPRSVWRTCCTVSWHRRTPAGTRRICWATR